MKNNTKAQQLRELLILARKLRSSAAETTDLDYIDLFLRAATALEGRAHRLAYGSPDQMAGPQTKPKFLVPVDLLC